jgi:hypothetical protein
MLGNRCWGDAAIREMPKLASALGQDSVAKCLHHRSIPSHEDQKGNTHVLSAALECKW